MSYMHNSLQIYCNLVYMNFFLYLIYYFKKKSFVLIHFPDINLINLVFSTSDYIKKMYC